MPIATIYSKNKKLTQARLEEIAAKWAAEIDVDVQDICITVISDFVQAGRQYDMLVNLFLPSIWRADQVKNIQTKLLPLLSQHCKITPSGIFIITTIILSGHVVEDGRTTEW